MTVAPLVAAIHAAAPLRRWPLEFTILGEPVSKANSRQLVSIRGAPRVIKSRKALRYVADATLQVPTQWPLLHGLVAVTLRMFYASERADLDESLVLDILQGRIYVNDRQVREKHVYHAIDRANPRVEVSVQVLTAQQAPLL